jgi:hypothetical protein
MRGRLRAMVGVVTTALALGVGGLALAEGRAAVGGVLVLAGLYRGLMLARELRDEA